MSCYIVYHDKFVSFSKLKIKYTKMYITELYNKYIFRTIIIDYNKVKMSIKNLV